MRTTYDILPNYRPHPLTRVSSSRRYSRHGHELLSFFSLHRTALAAHVQRQYPHFFQTDRATRMHLQTLVASKDLAVREGRGIGQANVYIITQRGLRKVREDVDDLDERASHARKRMPTGSHMLHELLITETAVSIAEQIRLRHDLSLPWHDRFGLLHHPVFHHLLPDYAFLLCHAQGLLLCFVEVSSGEDSPTRLGQKLNAYAAWAADPDAQTFLTDLYRQYGAQEPRPQFRLVYILHDRRSGNDTARLRQTLAQTLELPRTMRQRVWLASVSDLTVARTIDDPVWYRARDLDSSAAEWEMLPHKERLKRLRALFPLLPRHSLFPLLEIPTHVASSSHQPHGLADPARSDSRPVLGRIVDP